MVDFGGWEMPVSTRPGSSTSTARRARAVGLFDVSHMGEVALPRRRAPPRRSSAWSPTTSRTLADGRALYTVACLPTGGIVDD